MDRRQLPRWEIKKPIQVRIGAAEGFSDAYMEDLNLKGMCLAMPKSLAVDQFIKLEVKISDSIDIEIEAVVPWIKIQEGKYVHGLSFVHVMDADKEKIDHYITANCAKQMRQHWWDGA